MTTRKGIVRWTAIFIVAMTLAVGYHAYRATTPQGTVAAALCSWEVEHNGPIATANFYSPYFQATDTLHAQIITYVGIIGTGYQCPLEKHYVSKQWTTLGTPGSYTTWVRVWVCGYYDGTNGSYTSSVQSPDWHYPQGCVRQADNLNSYFHITATGTSVAVYVNQG